MLDAGATFVTKGHAFRTCDRNAATSLLDRMLSRYDLADEVAAKTEPTSPTRAAA
jgi:4-hydroxyphenylacetate 3-monooxygenase